MNNYIVYMHICPNGKKYIGITSKKNPNHRWLNGYGYHNQSLFYKAILKYGWDNIEHKILYCNISQKQALNLEEELIKLYNTQNINFGYNICKGGEGSTLGYKFTKEQKQKLSVSKSFPIICIETGEIYLNSKVASEILQHDINKVVNKPNRTICGKHWARINDYDKYMYKLSKYVISNFYKKNNKKMNKPKYFSLKKKTLCVETGEIFESTVEAQNKYNCKHICQVCNKKRKTAGGYHWEYI